MRRRRRRRVVDYRTRTISGSEEPRRTRGEDVLYDRRRPVAWRRTLPFRECDEPRWWPPSKVREKTDFSRFLVDFRRFVLNARRILFSRNQVRNNVIGTGQKCYSVPYTRFRIFTERRHLWGNYFSTGLTRRSSFNFRLRIS